MSRPADALPEVPPEEPRIVLSHNPETFAKLVWLSLSFFPFLFFIYFFFRTSIGVIWCCRGIRTAGSLCCLGRAFRFCASTTRSLTYFPGASPNWSEGKREKKRSFYFYFYFFIFILFDFLI